jgi:hypothetical protein
VREQLANDVKAAIAGLGKPAPKHGASPACAALSTFVDDATSNKNLQPKGPLSAADSAALVAEATRIQAVLGC